MDENAQLPRDVVNTGSNVPSRQGRWRMGALPWRKISFIGLVTTIGAAASLDGAPDFQSWLRRAGAPNDGTKSQVTVGEATYDCNMREGQAASDIAALVGQSIQESHIPSTSVDNTTDAGAAGLLVQSAGIANRITFKYLQDDGSNELVVHMSYSGGHGAGDPAIFHSISASTADQAVAVVISVIRKLASNPACVNASK